MVSEAFGVHYNVGEKCKSRHGVVVCKDGRRTQSTARCRRGKEDLIVLRTGDSEARAVFYAEAGQESKLFNNKETRRRA